MKRRIGEIVGGDDSQECQVRDCKEMTHGLFCRLHRGADIKPCKMCNYYYLHEPTLRDCCKVCSAKLPAHRFPDMHRGVIKYKAAAEPKETNVGNTFIWRDSKNCALDPEAGTDFLGVILGINDDDNEYHVCYLFLGKYSELGHRTQKCIFPGDIEAYISRESFARINPKLLNCRLIPMIDSVAISFDTIDESNIENVLWMDPETKCLTQWQSKSFGVQRERHTKYMVGFCDDEIKTNNHFLTKSIRQLDNLPEAKVCLFETRSGHITREILAQTTIKAKNITIPNNSNAEFEAISSAKWAENVILSPDNFKSYLKYLIQTRSKLRVIFFDNDSPTILKKSRRKTGAKWIVPKNENVEELFRSNVLGYKIVLAMVTFFIASKPIVDKEIINTYNTQSQNLTLLMAKKAGYLLMDYNFYQYGHSTRQYLFQCYVFDKLIVIE
ncbi:MAG: hypothetical protein Hyperionvirus7_46 [Hyperionvirus sp.]|uniref:Uncharacterized protein n=1 Tax=Hyperionvirus sp. TaxID=2487770 RepID=A0A3G5A898_9VIRU|nr:MAG: hypothetical protein Hyperionvirus7_46 [Hyperionvirus sp.]